ncbi:sigma-70 family RNA polymerase sigma factor [Methylobacterium iners]|uniref:RNA polymerase sigma factor n=1 Tax=Methylobacterium iners TaxID=418707 RepID=A0ABQ4RVA3_9HYPH|nr:sigma-70 family RNA polymerase sigma factor [Methylobacterium iners]GJD93629.1 hypothetical protein OCOJLMKI_0825 [Methylobacterium iners]
MSTAEFSEPLPDAIRQHLGQALALAYAGLPDLQSTDRFRSLLAQLERSLIAHGDRNEREFREALLAYLPNLVRYAMSLTKDRTRADDLVQETLFKSWRHRGRFEPGTNLGAWLTTIMRNTFFSSFGRAKLEVQDPYDLAADRMATLPQQGAGLDLRDLQAAMDKLPPAMREALVLVAINEVSYEKAAEIMGCQIGTAKSRVHRARAQLASLLEQDAAGFEGDRIMLAACSNSMV